MPTRFTSSMVELCLTRTNCLLGSKAGGANGHDLWKAANDATVEVPVYCDRALLAGQRRAQEQIPPAQPDAGPQTDGWKLLFSSRQDITEVWGALDFGVTPVRRIRRKTRQSDFRDRCQEVAWRPGFPYGTSPSAASKTSLDYGCRSDDAMTLDLKT